MKILLVNNQLQLGGAETVVRQLAAGLRVAGDEVEVRVAFGKRYPPDVHPFYPRVLSRLHHSRFHRFIQHIAPRAKWTDRAFRRLAVSDADVIHLHNFHGNYASLESLAFLAARKPLVWTFHALWGVTGGCDHPRDCHRYLDACGECPQLGRWPLPTHDNTAAQLAAKLAQLAPLPLHIVAPSRWLAEIVRASHVGRHWQVHHIPNAVDTDFSTALPATARPHGEHDPARILVLVNRNFRDEQKGFPILHSALAVAKVAPSALQPRLVLVGDNSGWAREQLPGWPCESLGYISDRGTLARLYRSSDLYLYASPRENFPCVTLEAMAAACCVVATPTDGIVEQIEDGVSGVLASEISGPALGDALRRALGDATLRARTAETARERASRDFNQTLFIERHRQLYAEILQTWQPPA